MDSDNKFIQPTIADIKPPDNKSNVEAWGAFLEPVIVKNSSNVAISVQQSMYPCANYQ